MTWPASASLHCSSPLFSARARDRRWRGRSSAPSLGASLPSALPSATDPAAAHQRAQTVLSAWAKAVVATGGHASVTPVGELTGQVGDWEEAVGDNNKRALMAGMVASVNPLSEQAPPDGEVAWQDGTTTKVPLLSAQEAIVAIESTTAAPCDRMRPCSCVTDARLTSGPIQTSRGPATAPIWEFTVQGTAVKVTRVADRESRWLSSSPGEGRSAARAGDRLGQRDGRRERTHRRIRRRTGSGEHALRRGLHGGSRRVRSRGRRHRDAASPWPRPSQRRARPSGRGARQPPRWPPRSAIESCSTCSREPRSPSC